MAKKIKVAQGFVLVRHADPSAACEFGQAEGGLLVVPASAVDDLRAHGFTPDGELAEQDPIAPEPAADPELEPESVIETVEAAPEAAPEA